MTDRDQPETPDTTTPAGGSDTPADRPEAGDATAATEPIATEPIATGPIAAGPTATGPAAAEPGPAAQPAPVPAAAEPVDNRIRVKRSWIVAGAGVSAAALLGAGFGLGYITADQTGNHGDHSQRYERSEVMRGFSGEVPGNEFGPGRRWRVTPPNGDGQDSDGQNPEGQTPTAPGQQNQNPQTTAPQTPGTAS
ncbi:hypothetical protein [Gordonia hydrophobica]|uniref:Uncharacterized protein n=1 Tax=Gordonia hydrophobica TaxID=40516 RepID=A0ABZ2U3Z1_9ACTN|nr:hypothetical protein [Gordonia hydrophobica]MBM7368048.1 hypothetical protein [Gordonia hydrophobica]